MDTPYVIVGGSLKARIRTGRRGVVVISASKDGTSWTEVARAEGSGTAPLEASLDPQFPNEGQAIYGYRLKAELRYGAGLDSIVIENDLQMAPLSLPALELGDNRISYTDETVAPHSGQLTFDWVERSGVSRPGIPAGPSFPQDGAQVEGTRFVLRWVPAQAPAGEHITAYHFQLSDEPKFRWALTPAFDEVLPAAKRELASQLYLSLANALSGKSWFPGAWSLEKVAGELGRFS
jgi:hypothetical protein